MVYPRARAKRSFAAFIAMCALLALSVTRADSRHESAVLASEHRTTRSLDASVIIVEGEAGTPAILVDDGMQLTSIITITAVDTPVPVYGTNDDQPTLPPDDDDDGSLPPQVTFPDVIETHAPNFDDPFVLIETYAPADVGNSGDASAPTPCPSTAVPASASAEPTSDVPVLGASLLTDAPVTDGPKDEDPAFEAPLTETPGTSDPTNVAISPGSDTPSSADAPATVTVTTMTSEPPTVATSQPSPDSATETPTMAPSSDTLTPTVVPISDTPTAMPAPVDDRSSSTAAPTPAIPDELPPQVPTLNPRLFGTKTAYWDQRSVFIDDSSVKQLIEKAEQELSELTLLQVQQVTRHGIRSRSHRSCKDSAMSLLL